MRPQRWLVEDDVRRERESDLFGLRVLVVLRDEGSQSRTAARLRITQQAVSERLRQLESRVGLPLIVRSSRGSKMTAAGDIVAGWAADVLAAAEHFDARMDSLEKKVRQELDVAASLTVAEYLLPRWLVELRQQQEDSGRLATHVGLSVVNSEKVMQLVRSRNVPLGFIETPDVPSDLMAAIIGFDELQVVVSPGHPWAAPDKLVTARELSATSLVTRESGSGTRKAFEFFMRESYEMTVEARATAETRAGLEIAQPRAELNTTAAVRTAIAAGTAPGVLSSLAVADDLMLGRLVRVNATGVRLSRRLTAIWKSGAQPPAGLARELVTIAASSNHLLVVPPHAKR